MPLAPVSWSLAAELTAGCPYFPVNRLAQGFQVIVAEDDEPTEQPGLTIITNLASKPLPVAKTAHVPKRPLPGGASEALRAAEGSIFMVRSPSLRLIASTPRLTRLSLLSSVSLEPDPPTRLQEGERHGHRPPVHARVEALDGRNPV